MMGFLTFVLKLFDPVGRIADKIAQMKIEQARAATDREKIAADERIKALEARRQVLVAESGSRINQFIRAAITGPFIIYFWKLIVWDKVIMGGRVATDDLGDRLWWVATVILGFYFVTDVTQQVVRSFRR